ncbi:MAG: hypothetical protein IJK98_06090, partial [Clostridia bacterium]|nr:hypothetical protein [Clostridia bacterium]
NWMAERRKGTVNFCQHPRQMRLPLQSALLLPGNQILFKKRPLSENKGRFFYWLKLVVFTKQG